jgi:spectrin beta
LEQAENLLKRHQDFITTMDANDEKIRKQLTFCNLQLKIAFSGSIVMFGDRLCNDGHYAADKIHKKARNIQERREANRERALAMLEKLKESLGLQQFLSDCEELREWIEEKMIRAQDETYRDAKTITSKFVRHQAFKSGKYFFRSQTFTIGHFQNWTPTKNV